MTQPKPSPDTVDEIELRDPFDWGSVTKNGKKAAAPEDKGTYPCLSISEFQQLVTLYAGDKPDAKAFTLHRGFASYHSPVFKTAFSSGFIEGKTQTYKISEAEPEIVRLLVHWIYTQQFDLQWKAEDLKEANALRIADYLNLIKLWILADGLLMPRLQNAVLRKFESVRKISGKLSVAVFRHVYDNTSTDSKLRSYLAHLCAVNVSADLYSTISKSIPHEMLIDLVTIFANTRVDLAATRELKDFMVVET